MSESTVVLLSPDVHSRFPALSSLLLAFDELVRQHEGRFLEEFVLGEGGDAALALEEKATILLQKALARSRLLAWTVAHCINADLSPGAYLATRAHFEMTALLAYTLHGALKWRSGVIGRAPFEATIAKLILARRVPFTEEEEMVPQWAYAVNVLTMLPATDAIFDSTPLGAKFRGHFKSAYEWLSEFCHPNAFAHAIIGAQRGGRRMTFEARPRLTEDDLSHLVSHANLTFELFLGCFDLLGDVINVADGEGHA